MTTKILLVDDDDGMCRIMRTLLEPEGFEITVANNVAEGLKCITAERFDVLLSDLHMPGPGDGLTMISAMRHVNPSAVALLLTGFPEMDVASRAILGQASEILVKSSDIQKLVKTIKQRLTTGIAHSQPKIESVATILERAAPECIEDWLREVQRDGRLSVVPLTAEQRYGHLPQVFRDLVARLRADLPFGAQGPPSTEASQHGLLRRQQGYSAAMLVEESRILQVCIFNTLQKSLDSIDFSVLLVQVMTIADEVDSQLRQAMECYVVDTIRDALSA
jgi:ActR/RegA family two-component response regulator